MPETPDAYDSCRRGFMTARSEIVVSGEESQIANSMFYNSVEYEYERVYGHDPARDRSTVRAILHALIARRRQHGYRRV